MTILVTAVALAAGEIGFRRLDNYSPRWLQLRRAAPSQSTRLNSLTDARAWDHVGRHVATLPVADGVVREWFDLDPPPASQDLRTDPGLAQRYFAHPGWELRSIYEWNRNYVLSL